MTQAPIAGDVAQPRNVLACLTAELALDDIILIKQRRETGDFVFAKFAGSHVRIDPRFVALLPSRLRTNAVQVRQRDGRRTIRGDIDT
jgi:hypothetical protein